MVHALDALAYHITTRGENADGTTVQRMNESTRAGDISTVTDNIWGEAGGRCRTL